MGDMALRTPARPTSAYGQQGAQWQRQGEGVRQDLSAPFAATGADASGDHRLDAASAPNIKASTTP